MGRYKSNPLFEKYAKVLTDPWNAEPCGVATGSPVASQVYRAFAQGTFAVNGTVGNVGGIQICPTMANDNIAINYTDSTYASSALPNNGAGAVPGRQLDSFAQLPYSASAFALASDTGSSTAVVGRVVALALRVTNTTSALNRSGKIRMGQTPFGTSVGQNFSYRQDLAAGNAFQEAASDRALEIRWQTNSIQDLEYNYFDTTTQERCIPLANKTNSDTRPLPVLYALVDGGGNVNTYDWQAVIVVEYAGFVLTGIPITGATRRLNASTDVFSFRQRVMEAAKNGDDPLSWLTRQGDRAMNIMFGRKIKDPTGRSAGSTTKLITDVVKEVLSVKAKKKK